MELSEKRIRELERAEAKLEALEAGGVDNWDFYDDSLEGWRKEEELEEKREELLDPSSRNIASNQCLDDPCAYLLLAGRQPFQCDCFPARNHLVFMEMED